MTDTPTHLEPLLDPVYRAEVALRLLLNIKPTASECCCNPRHLEPVTAAENLRRVPKILKTHCPQGHPYAFLNATSQRRVCVECNRKAAREYQQRKRDARV